MPDVYCLTPYLTTLLCAVGQTNGQLDYPPLPRCFTPAHLRCDPVHAPLPGPFPHPDRRTLTGGVLLVLLCLEPCLPARLCRITVLLPTGRLCLTPFDVLDIGPGRTDGRILPYPDFTCWGLVSLLLRMPDRHEPTQWPFALPFITTLVLLQDILNLLPSPDKKFPLNPLTPIPHS